MCNSQMDCDYDPNAGSSFHEEMIGLSSKRKRKRESRLARALKRKKPVFEPTSSSFEAYFDEYYKMDYEDIIGDLPVRFKYRNVRANDFGLTSDEILNAEDKELNRWCPLKKACQFRLDEEEKYDVQAYGKKARSAKLKKKILPSLYSEDGAEKSEDGRVESREIPESEDPSVSVGAKQEIQKSNKTSSGGKSEAVEVSAESSTKKRKISKEKRRKSNPTKDPKTEYGISDDRLKAYGINPKKFKNKLKYGKKQ